MPNCAISNCKNTSKLVCRERGSVSYHRFPRDPYVKEKWIDATGNKNWFPTKYSTICSIHFKEDDYLPTKKRKLFDKAYPTLDILKTTKGEEDIIIQQHCTVQKETPLEDTPQIRKLRKIIRYKNLKIKRLQEQNRRKLNKIISLKTIIDRLTKKAFVSEEHAESINVTTKKLMTDEKCNENKKRLKQLNIRQLLLFKKPLATV